MIRLLSSGCGLLAAFPLLDIMEIVKIFPFLSLVFLVMGNVFNFVQADLSKPETIPATLVGIHTVIDCATGRPEEPIKTVIIRFFTYYPRMALENSNTLCLSSNIFYKWNYYVSLRLCAVQVDQTCKSKEKSTS